MAPGPVPSCPLTLLGPHVRPTARARTGVPSARSPVRMTGGPAGRGRAAAVLTRCRSAPRGADRCPKGEPPAARRTSGRPRAGGRPRRARRRCAAAGVPTGRSGSPKTNPTGAASSGSASSRHERKRSWKRTMLESAGRYRFSCGSSSQEWQTATGAAPRGSAGRRTRRARPASGRMRPATAGRGSRDMQAETGRARGRVQSGRRDARAVRSPSRARWNCSRPSWNSSPRKWQAEPPRGLQPARPCRLRYTAMFRPRSASVRRDTSAGTPRSRWWARMWGSAATNTYAGKQRRRAPEAQSSSGRSTSAADLSHVPDELLDATPPGAGAAPGRRASRPPADELVDVLVRYGQVQQLLGQLIGIRKHATPPCRDLVVNGSDAVVCVRSEEYVAREER